MSFCCFEVRGHKLNAGWIDSHPEALYASRSNGHHKNMPIFSMVLSTEHRELQDGFIPTNMPRIKATCELLNQITRETLNLCW